jgi:excisionase family DNA binding protein
MTPSGLPTSEPFLTRSELADRLGLSVDTVDRLVKQGMPSETWGIRARRFQYSAVTRWLRSRETGRMAA